ncbi:DNRLRE domain-containing protein [Litorilinea aerophila]|uniref:DNRLRE domain-containing protein n=1 Tax=Litorilinea aerophila TaxID=1204385 RepID=A0A540VCI9_9CHLR|nr:DNRLRE domain-containing protein [Litorilinea aerophila]
MTFNHGHPRRFPYGLLGAIPILLLSVLWVGLAGLRPARGQAALFTAVLPVQEDAAVYANTPDANYGAGSLGAGPNVRSYLRFDLSSLPANATIQQATLRVKAAESSDNFASDVSIGRVDGAWSEMTVTWNSRPPVTPGSNSSTVVYPGSPWVAWDVTPLVQAWFSGAQTNYGFVLGTGPDQQLVRFQARESGIPPELVVDFTMPEDDDPDRPVPQENPFTDLGDAPDSSNNHGQNNTAYPGTLGHFPTVYQNTPPGQPAGPRHVNASMEAILGDGITREREADGGPDADGVNNILREPPPGAGGVVDVANNDRADDGWRNRSVPILDCRRTTLVVRVRKAPGAQLDHMRLNVWFDGNQDGDWEDTGICQFEDGQQARAYEWIVQDYLVDLSAIPAGASQNITVTTVLVHNPAPNQEADGRHWMRFTLSEQEAPRNPDTDLADGRGPHPASAFGTYAFGETEDLVYRTLPEGQPGTLELQKAVTVSSTPVAYGDTVTYTIRLKHRGGSGPVQAEIRDRLPYPQHLLPQMIGGNRQMVKVTERSPGVNPLNARVEVGRNLTTNVVEQRIRWKGTLAPDAEVELSFLVHVHPVCRRGEGTVTLANTASLHAPDGTRQDEKMVQFDAACPSYSLDDIEVEQQVLTDGNSAPDAQSAALEAPSVPLLSSLDQAWMRSTFTNRSGNQVTLGISLNFEEIKVTGASTAATEQALCRSLTLQPGESRAIDRELNIIAILIGLLEEIPDDPAQEVELRSRLRYTLLPPGESLDCALLATLAPEQVGEQVLPLRVRPWDLGDAPDSSNHAAAAMTAYPGVPANFPTVFDVATGAPEGPRHARPRPFHLGQRVEFEPDADLAPAPRNINPSTNTANRDRYDDGINLGSVNFQHCQNSTFQVRVFIHGAAQAALLDKGIDTAYINAWVDGNRDGDWADVAQCDNTSAPEHIVIDAPVDIASLVPGVNTLTVSTSGPVPWPPEQGEQPAWLRVMLSEEKSVKLTGQPYGDGRGPASGYRTGETEDYLLRPQGQGADPAVDVQVHWEPLPLGMDAGAAGVDMAGRSRRLTLKIEYHNNGSEAALDNILTITRSASLQNATILDVVSVPNLGIDKSTPNLDAIEIGDLEPGEGGTVLVSWKVEEGESVQATTLQNQVQMESRQSFDADPSNNGQAWEIPSQRRLPTLGWAMPCVPYAGPGPSATITSQNAATLRGTAEPDSSLVLLLEPLGDEEELTSASVRAQVPLTAPVQVGPTGSWVYQFDNLANGSYRVGVRYGSGAGMSGAWLHGMGTVWGSLVVDSSLPVDPACLVATDGQGRSFQEASGLNQLEPFGLPPLRTGLPYTLTARVTPGRENVRMALLLPAVQQLFYFEDLGNGTLRWSGCLTCVDFTAGAAIANNLIQYSLVVEEEGQENAYSGNVIEASSGIVRDALTGQPMPGATVQLLVQVPLSEATGSVYDVWSGAQPNPQQTDAQGGYLFAPPAGTYRLYVTAPGYQPYRSGDLAVANGEVIAQAIALTPAVQEAPDVWVAVGDGGFNPAVLTVPPGTVVRWVNVGSSDHSVVGSGLDSGWLSPGESYTITAGQAGTYPLQDGADPFTQATLVVDAEAPDPSTQFIFLPVIAR